MATFRRRDRSEGKAWQAVIRRTGFRPKSRVFLTANDAKAWARRVEGEMIEGRLPAAERAALHTAEEAVDRYVRDVLPFKTESKDFLRVQKTQFAWWRKRLGKTLLCHVTPGLLAECRDGLRSSGRAPATVNRYLAALSHCLTVARKEWGWIAANPAFDVAKCKEPPPKARPLSSAERRRLEALPDDRTEKSVC